MTEQSIGFSVRTLRSKLPRVNSMNLAVKHLILLLIVPLDCKLGHQINLQRSETPNPVSRLY